MCGVVAVWHHSSGPDSLDTTELDTMAATMVRRGPDGHGTFVGDQGRLGLAHRRLAIIGLGEQGHQPMQLRRRCQGSDDLAMAISYNGEIYNFSELRSELETSGHRLESSSDTEVLLHLYEHHGPSFVRRLRGMFAFALWDGAREELHLARDPLGIKPLYVAEGQGVVRVASQARSLLAGDLDVSTSDAALAGFLMLGSVPEPLTCWSSIRSVEAGTVVTWRRGGDRTVERFYDLASALAAPPAAHVAPGDLAGALDDSVRAHLIADVEVGLFLSGGIDSNALLGAASAQGHSVTGITLGFSDFVGTDDDETVRATIGAKAYGAEHTVQRLSRSDVVSSLPSILTDMDQPSVDGINTWLVSRAAAEAGLKVAISGVGADEFLGGYSTFDRVPRHIHTVGRFGPLSALGVPVRKLGHCAGRWIPPKTSGLLEYGTSVSRSWLLHRCVFTPWELRHVLGADRADAALRDLDLDAELDQMEQAGPIASAQAIAALEGGFYMRNQLLRDADWAGMAHSLEIRVPFADTSFVSTAAALLPQWSFRAGKMALANAPSPALPTAISAHSKSGFSIPMASWVLAAADYDAWKTCAYLVRPSTSWARRWAFVVARRFGML